MATTVLNPARAGWRDYYRLCKPNVVLLIVFTAVVGMLLAVPGSPPLVPMLAGTLGIALAASSAAAINHLLDARVDAQMRRTRNRPLPRGQLQPRNVLVFALVLGVLLINGTISGMLGTILTIVAIAFLVTSLISWCPAYVPFGVSTGGSEPDSTA